MAKKLTISELRDIQDYAKIDCQYALSHHVDDIPACSIVRLLDMAWHEAPRELSEKEECLLRTFMREDVMVFRSNKMTSVLEEAGYGDLDLKRIFPLNAA